MSGCSALCDIFVQWSSTTDLQLQFHETTLVNCLDFIGSFGTFCNLFGSPYENEDILTMTANVFESIFCNDFEIGGHSEFIQDSMNSMELMKTRMIRATKQTQTWEKLFFHECHIKRPQELPNLPQRFADS